MKLPEPSEEELAISKKLQQKIQTEIFRNGGWISFSRYMEMALYEPGLGYYSVGARKMGKRGDFVTAPEISSLFGITLARAILPFLQQSAFHILEVGAGTGRLAHDVLTGLRRLGYDTCRYDILDVSGGMKSIQKETLKSFSRVRWLDSLLETFTGVILGNEVLDAMPVCRIIKKEGQWHELGVGIIDEKWVIRERPVNSHVKEQIRYQIPNENTLPEGYITEVHPYAGAFIRSLAKMQKAGKKSAAILIDYGYPAREYYLPQRNKGTFLAYYRHHVHADPFLHIGLQDMTAHVDFTMIANSASEYEMAVLLYATQAKFLLANGITDHLLQVFQKESPSYLQEAQKMQMLLSPAEMGELFKVLIMGNLEVPSDWVLFDCSERL